MTKNVKLTQNYIDTTLKEIRAKGMKFTNGKDFMYIPRGQFAEGESYRVKDIVANPTKVPVYIIPEAVSKKYTASKKPIPEDEIATYIVRHEGSNATPPTTDILYYGCNCGETMTIATVIVNSELIGIVEEVV